MESTIRISGFCSSTAAMTSVRRVSERIYRLSGKTPKRSARSFSCRSLSSPETYNTLLPLQRLLQICRSSVDLPIPGAPPTKTRLPATAPPPRTRSSSPIPVVNRISQSDRTSRIRCATRLWPTGAGFPLPTGVGRSICSSNVFQAPQAGHLPCHFGDSFPQSVQ